MPILGYPAISITDSTSVGRSVLTAANAAAGATALGLGTGDTVTHAGLLVSDLTSGRVPRASTSGRLVNSAYDTGSAFGYGVSPSYLAHFKNDTNATIFFVTDNASTGASAAAGFAGISNSAFVSVKAYGSGNASGTYCEIRASAGFLAVLLGATERWRWDSSGHFTATEGVNIVLGTSTGTKIGTATTQKLGFWNATPVVQPASANQAAITDTAGATYGATEQTMLANIKTLLNQVRADLVTIGAIKGAA